MSILEPMSSKIIDCFIFYNELELLTYRLNILNNIVDYFVIVESTHTFTGKEKALIFNENKHLFEKFKDKIIHIIVEDFPYKYPNINFDNDEQWRNETHQRNNISTGLKRISLNDQDLIIISDLDEIPDPVTLYKCKTNEIHVDIHTLEQDFYYYNLNSLIRSKWQLCKIISYKKYKQLDIKCNDIRHYDTSRIIQGGWHLSYFGNSEFIKNKIINFSHQELNIENFTNITNIEERVKNGADLFNRSWSVIHKIAITDNNYLPPEYDVYLNNFFE